MVISSLGPTLPSLAEITHSKLSLAGSLFSARSLGYLLGSLFLGHAYDRVQGNRLLAATILISALLMALVPLSPMLILTGIILFIIGLGLGGIDVGSNTLTIWHYKKNANPYLNALYLFSGIGGFIVPLLVGRILSFDLRVHNAYWILSLLMIPPALWLFNQPSPSPSIDIRKEDKKETNLVLIALFGLLFFIFVGTEVSFGGWIYTFTLSYEYGQIATASLMNANFWLALTLGRLLAIPISLRFEPEKILQFNLTAAIISLGIILLFSGSLISISVGTFGFGFALASNFPMTYSVAKKHIIITGRLTGILWALGSLGAIITPWLIGGLIEYFSPIALITTLFGYLCAGLLLLAMIIIYLRSITNSG